LKSIRYFLHFIALKLIGVSQLFREQSDFAALI